MSAETPGTGHDDAEGQDADVLALMREIGPIVEERRHYGLRIEDAEVYARTVLASDWLTAYVTRKVAAAERERDVANGALHIAPEVLRLAEMSDQVGAWRKRAEGAERERDEARAEASDVGHDYDRRGERLWRLAALAGWTPGNESDNDATAELYVTDAFTEARAMIERVTALLADDSVVGTLPNGREAPLPMVYKADLRAALAPATEPASDDRPLTLDEHLAGEAAAERRGAVNALREYGGMWPDSSIGFGVSSSYVRRQTLARADRIEERR